MIKIRCFLFLFGLIVFLICLNIVHAEIMIIQPSYNDSFVDEENPKENYGGSTVLEVKAKTSGSADKVEHIYIIFYNLTSLPSGTIINSALLGLYMYDAPSSSRNYEIYRVTGNWYEGNGSYVGCDASLPGTCGAPLGEYAISWTNKPPNELTATTINSTGTAKNVWLFWDVTQDVQYFLTNPSLYFGWMIKDQVEHVPGGGSLFAKFYSREYTNVSLSPKLEINYTIPTCGLSISPPLSFGNLNSGDTSTDQSTTITNTGNVVTTSITIEGTDWNDDGVNIMSVGQTHWALISDQDYDTQMTALSTSPTDLGINVSPDLPLPLYFKLRIPEGQPSGTYTQTITFTSNC